MCERLLTMIGRELGRTRSRHIRGRNMKVHAIRKVYSQVIYTFSSQAMWFLCFLVTQESGAVGLARRICIALAFLFRTEAGSLLMNNLMNQILCHGPRKPKRFPSVPSYFGFMLRRGASPCCTIKANIFCRQRKVSPSPTCTHYCYYSFCFSSTSRQNVTHERTEEISLRGIIILVII